MKQNHIVILTAIAAFLLFIPEISMAADYYGPADMVGDALQKSTTAIMGQLTGIAFKMLFGLSLLKFAIQGYGLINQGDIEMSIGKWAKSLIWISFVVWLMSPAASPVRDGLSNGADFIQSTTDYFLGLASKMSGGDGVSFSAGEIFSLGLQASHNLIFSVAKATAGNVVNAVLAIALPNVTIFTALMLMVMNLVILLTTGWIAVKVFMVKLDAAIVIAISPLSFSLMGLDALKEQGLAPFKNLITIIYRIVILASIVSALKIVSDFLSNVLHTNASGGVSDVWTPITAAIFGYLLLAYMAHRSDAIAQSLSSGSSMFSAGDMASSVATGVAAGMAVAAGGAAAAETVGKAGQSMGDFIKSLSTDGGSISNASGSGQGGFGHDFVGSAPVAPPKPPEMSLQELRNHPSVIGNRKESFPFNLAGIPQSPSGSSSPSSAKPSSQPVSGSNSGSGSSAGIGGASSGTDQKLDKLIDSMSKPAQKPSFGDRLSTLNDHVAKEQTTVQANVNVNAHDH